MTTFTQLKKFAITLGAEVTKELYPDAEVNINIAAPDHKQWTSGQCVNMLGRYWTYIKTGDGSRDETIKELLLRLKEGLEDYDSTINGEEETTTRNEGWSIDVSSRNKNHYYKDGVSLCGKATEKNFFKHFDKDRRGSKYSHDCVQCIKLKEEIKNI